MALPAKRLIPEIPMDDRIIRLEERFERLQVDVTDIKTDINRVDGKVDTLRDSVANLQGEMKDGFIALMNNMLESERAIRAEFKTDMQQLRNDVREDMQQQRNDVREDMQQLRNQVREDISMFRSDALGDAEKKHGETRTALEKLHKEQQRLLWGGLGGCTFILAALAGGYFRLDDRLIDIEKRLPPMAAPETAARPPDEG